MYVSRSYRYEAADLDSDPATLPDGTTQVILSICRDRPPYTSRSRELTQAADRYCDFKGFDETFVVGPMRFVDIPRDYPRLDRSAPWEVLEQAQDPVSITILLLGALGGPTDPAFWGWWKTVYAAQHHRPIDLVVCEPHDDPVCCPCPRNHVSKWLYADCFRTTSSIRKFMMLNTNVEQICDATTTTSSWTTFSTLGTMPIRLCGTFSTVEAVAS